MAHAAGELGDERLYTSSEYDKYSTQRIPDIEALLSALFESTEGILFLVPMGAHNAIAIEAWQVVAQWHLQTDDENTTHAIRYGAAQSDPEYTQTLANLKSRIIAAVATDAFAGKRIANVSGLTQYYHDIGAYSDITPGDGVDNPFVPANPPAAGDCSNGTAVPSPESNSGLVKDCNTLLALRDTLAGTASLDWSDAKAISSWKGVTLTHEDPKRVERLDLPAAGLTGAIPPGLGALDKLQAMELQNNQLAGSIPPELGALEEMDSIVLSNNQLTAIIPA